MVDRAMRLCDDEFLEEELTHIYRTLIQNDYPGSFITECMRKRVAGRGRPQTRDRNVVIEECKRSSTFTREEF
uniref:Helix-turn-helix domain-containing protein n=1 Tax=Trichuris muris TaxID=70415 RepID=A0A5S6R5Q7_TRIMR